MSNDATRTGESVRCCQFEIGESVHQKVCDLNVMTAVSDIVGIATFLSGAADDGAATLMPRSSAMVLFHHVNGHVHCQAD